MWHTIASTLRRSAVESETSGQRRATVRVAMQGGDYVAGAIRRSLANREPLGPFRYRDKGNMAVVGRAFAIADLHKIRLKGLIAWFAWLFIHILYLTSFRSRLFVFQRWVAGYLFANRSAVVFDAPTPMTPVTAPQADVAPAKELQPS